MATGDPQATILPKPSVIPITPLNDGLLLMILMLLVSLWATFDINYSLPKISGMVLGLSIFIDLYIVAFWMLIRTWQSVYVNVLSISIDHPTKFSFTKPASWLSIVNAPPLTNAHLIQMEVLGLGAGLLAHIPWGLTGAMALGARPAFPFWIILGLICWLHQQNQDHRTVVEGVIYPTRTKDVLRK